MFLLSFVFCLFFSDSKLVFIWIPNRRLDSFCWKYYRVFSVRCDADFDAAVTSCCCRMLLRRCDFSSCVVVISPICFELIHVLRRRWWWSVESFCVVVTISVNGRVNDVFFSFSPIPQCAFLLYPHIRWSVKILNETVFLFVFAFLLLLLLFVFGVRANIRRFASEFYFFSLMYDYTSFDDCFGYSYFCLVFGCVFGNWIKFYAWLSECEFLKFACFVDLLTSCANISPSWTVVIPKLVQYLQINSTNFFTGFSNANNDLSFYGIFQIDSLSLFLMVGVKEFYLKVSSRKKALNSFKFHMGFFDS